MMYERHKNGGYTLLELIVSVAIFSMVMLVITGAYLTLISLDRKARGLNELAANLSFTVDSMTRAVRTGNTYSCNGGGNGTCTCTSSNYSTCAFSFKDNQNRTVTYRLKSDGTVGQCIDTGCSDSTAVSLTDTKIDIAALTFYVRGVGTSDSVQPQVTFTIRGDLSTEPGKTASFTIQSAATQRIIEI